MPLSQGQHHESILLRNYALKRLRAVERVLSLTVEFVLSLVLRVPRGGHDFLRATPVRAEAGGKPEL